MLIRGLDPDYADPDFVEQPHPRFRNNCAAIQSIRHTDEFVLGGPFQTTKTWACLWLLDTLLREYPNARASMLRKVRADMDSTVLETWRSIIAIRGGVSIYGGSQPDWYDYPNGSRLYIGGLDKPGKTLSGERDFIYVNQAEQLDAGDWETATGRATGRGGHAFDENSVPFTIVFGDANPGHPTHWILLREKLRLLPTYHEDNPSLYDDDGQITPLGVQTMEVLDAFTGANYQRNRLGKWFASEGIILEDFRDEIGHPLSNVSYDAEYIPGAGPILLTADDGYSGEYDPVTDYFKPNSHPRAIILAQLMPDGNLHAFYESFKVKTLDREHLAELFETFKENNWPLPQYAVVDKSAAKLKREFYELGITYCNGANSVEESLKELMDWIKPDLNGVIRLLIHPRCTKLRLEARLYARDKDGKIIKDNDHGWDGIRYLCHRLRYEKAA